LRTPLVRKVGKSGLFRNARSAPLGFVTALGFVVALRRVVIFFEIRFHITSATRRLQRRCQAIRRESTADLLKERRRTDRFFGSGGAGQAGN
jgi:hypothetical protein